MLNKAPTVYELGNLIKILQEDVTLAEVDGKWVPSRPLGYYSLKTRLKAAWLVFTGKADVVVWPGQ